MAMSSLGLTDCIQRPSFRLFVHIVLFFGYLCVGAAVFRVMERSKEEVMVSDLKTLRITFKDRIKECITDEQLEQFIEKVVSAANRGVSATRNVTMSEPNWSFGQAFFFSSTVLTTIGYGRVTPLSDEGKAFCIIYAVVGIPLTLILFTALTERVLIPVKAILYFLYRKLGHVYKVFHIQLLHLLLTLVALVGLFMLVPAAAYSMIEPTWNYMDAFYYCFISLTTIGLGDFIPGDNSDQPHRALYKVATTLYLLLGLLMMMVVLSVLYDIPELNLGFHFYLKKDSTDEEQTHLRRNNSDISGAGIKYRKQTDDVESQPVRGVLPVENNSAGTYKSFQDKDIDEQVQ